VQFSAPLEVHGICAFLATAKKAQIRDAAGQFDIWMTYQPTNTADGSSAASCQLQGITT
jgi:hypothetical protein